jgi:hypothetical protein
MIRLEDLGLYLLIVVALGNLAIVLLRRAGHERAADVIGQILPAALAASRASTWRDALRTLAISVLAGTPDAQEQAREAIKSTRPPSPPILPVLLLVLGVGCGGAASVSRGLEEVRDRLDEARPSILAAVEVARGCASGNPEAAAKVEDMIARLDLVWETIGDLLCLVVEDKTGCDQ